MKDLLILMSLVGFNSSYYVQQTEWKSCYEKEEDELPPCIIYKGKKCTLIKEDYNTMRNDMDMSRESISKMVLDECLVD